MCCILVTVVLFHIGCAVEVSSITSMDNVLRQLTTQSNLEEIHPYQFNSTAALIRKEGFEPEVHRVVTEDGYILHLTRIKNQGPPVLMVHGLLAASDTWLLRGRKRDLAFMLANKGFDVWLPDLRGNCFSRKHRSLKVAQKEFWDFSFHEMGIYDLPAFIKEVLKHSTYRKIFYIGHSMGTTVFTVMASLRPEFNKYIQTSIYLSPIVFLDEIKSNFLNGLYKQRYIIKKLFYQAQLYDIFPRNNITQSLAKAYCSQPMLEACLNFIGDMFGENRKNLNKAKFAVYLSSSVSGSSTKAIEHFTQEYNSDGFKQFDYGEVKNLQVYGEKTPPQYPLRNISVPIVFFYSKNDHLSAERSVQKLASLLPNVVYKEVMPKYTHIDYLYGMDAPKILYTKIVDMLSRNVV